MSRFKDIKERTLYGILAAVIAIGCTIMGGMAFIAMLLFALYVMAQEWDRLTKDRAPSMRWSGAFYLVISILCLLYLRLDITLLGGKVMPRGFSHHLVPILLLFAGVWATDIFAYIVGRAIGKHKMAPEISPGKSWEGLAGGMVACGALFGIASAINMFPPSFTTSIMIGLILAFIAQMGDLFESSMKRRAGVKDSGKLIPGHGGLLDRVDGLLAMTPVFTLIWVLV